MTSMGVVCTSFLILRRIFSLNFNCSPERKSSAVLTEPARCPVLELNSSTKSHAFHKDGGKAFVWKKRVTELLSIKSIVGFDVYHKKRANPRNVM